MGCWCFFFVSFRLSFSSCNFFFFFCFKRLAPKYRSKKNTFFFNRTNKKNVFFFLPAVNNYAHHFKRNTNKNTNIHANEWMREKNASFLSRHQILSKVQTYKMWSNRPHPPLVWKWAVPIRNATIIINFNCYTFI